jgi:hypothetical protein
MPPALARRRVPGIGGALKSLSETFAGRAMDDAA